ncbi:MAG: hypothetical protein P4L36_16995 [Holophaga sp.]|nr:hypothetical protein [Holophaga sp.]
MGICLSSSLAHAAWQPLDQQLINQSSEAWTIDFSTTPSARMGCSIVDGASLAALPVPPTECSGSKLLGPRARMIFYVDPLAPATPLGFTLRDAAGRQAEWRGSLERVATGPGYRFAQTGIESENLAVSWSPGRIIIRTVLVLGESKGEGKEEAKTVPEDEKAPPKVGKVMAVPAEKATATLPKLDAWKMEAGLGQSDRYWTLNKITLVKNWSGALHDFGNVLPADALADIFLNTVFQFNVYNCAGYSPLLDYDRIWTTKFGRDNYHLKVGLMKFSSHVGLRFEQIKHGTPESRSFENYRVSFEDALHELRANQDFLNLGIAYMRQKIVVEKLSHDLAYGSAHRSESELEDLQKIVLERDRLAIDLQAMIYYWMDQAFVEFASQYRVASAHGTERVGMSMGLFQPGFLKEPYYAEIIKNIRNYTLPTESVKGIKLHVPPTGRE